MKIDNLLNESNKNKMFYVSGYYNPKFKRATTNTKPTKMQIMDYKDLYPTAKGYVLVTLDKFGICTKNRFLHNSNHEAFETEYEAIEYYNSCIDAVLQNIDELKDKMNKLKL